jgi:hypothetical protein
MKAAIETVDLLAVDLLATFMLARLGIDGNDDVTAARLRARALVERIERGDLLGAASDIVELVRAACAAPLLALPAPEGYRGTTAALSGKVSSQRPKDRPAPGAQSRERSRGPLEGCGAGEDCESRAGETGVTRGRDAPAPARSQSDARSCGGPSRAGDAALAQSGGRPGASTWRSRLPTLVALANRKLSDAAIAAELGVTKDSVPNANAIAQAKHRYLDKIAGVWSIKAAGAAPPPPSSPMPRGNVDAAAAGVAVQKLPSAGELAPFVEQFPAPPFTLDAAVTWLRGCGIEAHRGNPRELIVAGERVPMKDVRAKCERIQRTRALDAWRAARAAAAAPAS